MIKSRSQMERQRERMSYRGKVTCLWLMTTINFETPHRPMPVMQTLIVRLYKAPAKNLG